MSPEQASAPIRPDSLTTIEHARDQWWVAHTRSRMEKAFARDLQHLNIDYFLPLTPQIRYSGGRKRKWLIPLFGGYVFFNGDDRARYRCMCTGRLCQTLAVPNQQELARQLSAIEKALDAGVNIAPAAQLMAGQRCRIRGGPLKGVEGKVIRTDGRTQVQLSVDLLGQGGLVEIEEDLVECLDPQEAYQSAYQGAGT